ncbi:MAG: aminopeptidase P family protein [Thermoguttaceae bacterium]|nr:aminopeptidase P family protein [Thermoguttaceae bacterium]
MSQREKSRRDKFYTTLERDRLDGYLIVDPCNVSYLTGFNGDDSYLWIGDAGACLLSDTRFEEQIKEESPDVGALIRCSGQTTIGLLEQAVSDVRYSSAFPKRVGIEASSTTVALFRSLRHTFPDVEFVPCEGDVEKLREIKDEGEIQAIRNAIDVTIDAYLDVKKAIGSDATEVDIRDELEYRMRKLGGDDVAFPSIVAFDARAALPHAIPTRRGKVADASAVLIDWGAKKDGYVGDMTRSYLTEKGLDPSNESKAYRAKFDEVFKIVLDAHDAAIDAMKPGVSCNEIDKIARDVIAAAGYGDYFGHGLGHGIGRVVHDHGGLSPSHKAPLAPNMVLTVEPGIYLPGWGGIRIEDDVLVVADGVEILTRRLGVDE